MSLYYLIHLFGVLLSCLLEFASTETVKPRIVGGDIVSNRTAFAYQACLRKNGRHHCGGTIIDARHVLTACHCCISQRGRIYEASELTITVGNLLLDGDPLAKTYKVKYIFTHLWYNPIRIINDICVLRISGDFLNWTNEINYIDLQDTSVKSGRCTVSGWGATKFGSPLPSPQLRSIEIPIISWYECRSYYRFLKGKQLCAHEKGKDSCQGDSGGPLICRGRLTGIVSYGTKCGVYPGVYTEVYRYLDWIEEQRRRSSAITISLSFILKIFVIFSILF